MGSAVIAGADEISVSDLPMSRKSGTARRRVLVVFNGTTANTADFFSLTPYIPGFDDIEGVLWHTRASVADSGTAVLWSSSGTISIGGVVGAMEIGLIVSLT